MAEIVERPKSVTETARDITKRFFRHENAALIAVLAAIIGGFGVVTNGLTITRVNVLNVLLQSSVRGLATIGQSFVVLSGGIDLTVGGVALFSLLLGSLVMTEGYQCLLANPMSMILAIPLMLLVGTLWGVANGSIVTRAGVPAIVATLGMWQVSRGAAFTLSKGTTVLFLPRSLAWFGQGNVGGFPVPGIIFIVSFAVGYFVLNHTGFGRTIYATGGNPISAWLCGINVKRTQLLAFIISGFLAALAGTLMLSRVMCASMLTLEGLEIDSLAAVFIGGISVMGGIGSIIGALIGVLIIGFINNGLSVMGMDPGTQGMVKGGIIVAAVAIDQLRRRRG